MQPFFIKSVSGNIFALYHPPVAQRDLRRNIIFVPPFAEELNRSRHMINRQARRLAAAGFGVLIPDLYGTGDSEGAYGDASIAIWRQDILAAVSWMKTTSGHPITLWAMRSGALLAADLAGQHPDLADQLLLWSPAGNGKKFISQQMRIKLAAGITGKTGGNPLTMKDLWAELDQGETLEIAGYDLSPDLAHGFCELSLDTVKLSKKISVKWLDISLNNPARMPSAAQKIIDHWADQGVEITAMAVHDIAFWTLQEPEWADEYIDQTMKLMIE